MKPGTRFAAPFALSSLAALAGFACAPAPEEDAPAAKANPTVEATDAPGGGEHGETSREHRERCRHECEDRFRNCMEGGRGFRGEAELRCNHERAECFEGCEMERRP